jgi:hypothetical protein
MIKNLRVPKSRPPTIYKRPQRIEPLGCHCYPPQGDRTRRSERPNIALASGHYTPSPWMVATCPSLNIVRWSLTVTKRSTRSQPADRTRPSIAPNTEPLRVRSFLERVHRTKIPTERVRSTLTWRAPVSGRLSSYLRVWATVTSAYVSGHRTRALRIRSAASTSR